MRLDIHDSATAEALEDMPDPGSRWETQSACRETETSIFYAMADGNGRPLLETTAPAKAVCQRCTVQAECLRTALWRGEAWGIWGGATPGQRAKLRRQINAKRRVEHRSALPVRHMTYDDHLLLKKGAHDAP